MKHFNSIGQVSTEGKYKYECPKFGKSNTDQSYYEPSSSRIANSLSTGLSEKVEVLSLEDCLQIPVKPNGITREELQTYSKKVENGIISDSKSKDKNKHFDDVINKTSELIENITTQMNTGSED